MNKTSLCPMHEYFYNVYKYSDKLLLAKHKVASDIDGSL